MASSLSLRPTIRQHWTKRSFAGPAASIASCQYLQRLTDGTLDERSALQVAREADGLSFAQLQEAYILAGQRAFRRSAGIGAEELTEAVRTIRNEVNGLISRGNGRFVGFGGPASTDRCGSHACGSLPTP